MRIFAERLEQQIKIYLCGFKKSQLNEYIGNALGLLVEAMEGHSFRRNLARPLSLAGFMKNY